MKKLCRAALLALSIIFMSNMFMNTITFAAGGSITVKGSTTVLPIAQAAAEEFMNQNPDINISVQGGGSGVGIASLLSGTCDIADASRAIKDKELKKAVDRGIKPKAHVIAMDGIAVIIHPSNNISGLTKAQIKDIYTGKVSNWSQVGGSYDKIVVISRDSSSGTFEAFNKLALHKAKVRKDALLSASNRAVVTTVSTTPGAVGYAGLGYISSSVKAITVDGIECTRKTVLDDSYPLARPLFMYTNGKPAGSVKAFISFILSENGQKLVEREGFVGLK